MKILSREEVVRKLVEEIGIFEKLYKDNQQIISRVKNAPVQLQMFGLLPYITFLVSKYKVNDNDREGYTIFLNFLIYISKELNLYSGSITANDLDKGNKEKLIEYLEWLKDLNDVEKKIYERNLMLILEEMKKIYGGIFKEREHED